MALRRVERLIKTVCTGIALLFIFALAAVTAGAQTDTGSITGTVTDNSGAAVPGAAVTVTSEGNGEARASKTNSTGNYSFPALPVGAYTVTIVSPGFQTLKEAHVVLDASSTRDLDNKLTVGQVSQEVVVTEVSEAQVNTSDAQIAATISSQQIDNISLNGRNYVQLVRLLPGAVATTLDPFAIQLGSMSTYINGIRGASILNMADGMILEDIGANISVFAVPNADSIAEVRVLQANFSADNPSPYGGPTINVITKTGGRSLHGNAFEFVRNTAFNAKSDFSAVNLPLHFHDYGFTLGGPVFIPGKFNADRKKLFFFSSEEWKIIHSSTNGVSTVPTPAQINGIFPGTTPVYQPGKAATKTTYAPGSCPQAPQIMQDSVTGYCVPNTAFSALGAKELSVYPAPNSGTSNYATPVFSNLDNREDRVNIDWLPNGSDVLSIHYAKELNNQSAGSALNVIPLTVTPRPAFITSINETHTFTPNLLNTLVVGITHNDFVTAPSVGKLSLASLGVTTNFPFSYNVFGVVPNLTLTGYTGYTTPTGDSKVVQNLLLTDDVSYIHGKHTLKFGVYMQKAKLDEHNLTSSITQGSVTYTGSSTGNAIADALTGNFASFTQASTPGFSIPRYFQQEYYAMDTWRATSRLVVQYGIRYIYPGLYNSAINGYDIFNPSAYSASAAPTVSAVNGSLSGSFNPYNGLQIVGTGFPDAAKKFLGNVQAITGTSPVSFGPVLTDPYVTALFGSLPRSIYDTPKTNVAPRFGFAYDLFGDGKTSVRGSFGLFFMRPNGLAYNNDASNAPFSSNVQITGGNINNPGGTAATLSPQTLYTFSPGFKSAYLETRSFGIQHQFPHALIVEVNYVGNQGLHLPLLLNINQLQANTLAITETCTGCATATNGGSTANANSLRPYKGYGAISQQLYADTSSYNGLQITVSRRVGKGFNFSASETFSKTLEGTSQNLPGTSLPMNSYNYKADYSVADIHRKNVVTANASYNLPFFLHSSNEFLRAGLGGWVLSGVQFLQSGQPNNIVLNRDYAGIGTDGQAERPQVAPGVSPYTRQNCSGSNKFTGNPSGILGCQYLTPYSPTNINGSFAGGGAFAVPAPGTFGNASRNYVVGPKFFQTDFSTFKDFRFSERYVFQFRAEAFNIFNHGCPLLSVAGAPGSASPSVTYGASTTFGVIQAASTGRVLQFGAKFNF